MLKFCRVSYVSEWVEFTPYEIGLPKYGTFMRSDMFGSKFFLGHLVKRQPEPPLHFLMGEKIDTLTIRRHKTQILPVIMFR